MKCGINGRQQKPRENLAWKLSSSDGRSNNEGHTCNGRVLSFSEETRGTDCEASIRANARGSTSGSIGGLQINRRCGNEPSSPAVG